jgi:hypothetical protein
MRRTSLRVGLAVLAAVIFDWLFTAIHNALFAVPVNGPHPYFHVPTWLEPFAYTARFLADLVPGVVLGAIARWRPGTLGLVVGLLSLLASAALPQSTDVVLSATGLDWALTRGIVWSVGAVVGMHISQRWLPNKSLERTRDR